VVLVGLIPEPVSLNALGLLAHEKEIVGSSAYVAEFPDAIALLARGRVRVEPLITGRVPLDRARVDGLDALLRREDRHVKILITGGVDAARA
jgi:(R,R)-butanediol dehydrogenase/meso-butanediol dehydrogenase/diacetyl reductase